MPAPPAGVFFLMSINIPPRVIAYLSIRRGNRFGSALTAHLTGSC
jgi:hypothetical protein